MFSDRLRLFFYCYSQGYGAGSEGAVPKRVQAIRQQPQSSQYNLLAAEFGDDVAERMTRTWDQQALWQQRVQAFVVDKERILADQSLNGVQQAAQIAELRKSRFSSQEQKRFRVFLENPNLIVIK
ncbi:hypothetical protein GZ77_04830 [Endozoicomonas montiporae]|uniref:Lipase chaperone n=2 Tax=Endozoicomonas montiporae TaxID=1027273 RepID=A0A081NBM1_9GAMM|nr:lipase secretion chaperone [Endozoicomonas montiporae]AMO56138.1 lipase chaperone [Endozoicomonas montiporae CL-33]KEQ15844.1 hypothetical protein GZ77_04830 [Endozoicomonas montiporae]